MPHKKKILLTGFGPFLNHGENPSEVLVKSLADIFQSQSNIRAIILPTEYSRSWDILEAEIDDFCPDIVLSFGLAARRKHICLEASAYNSVSIKLADASGYIPQNSVMIEGAPSSYKSNLPLTRIEKSLRSKGHKLRISRDAGDYVCNATLFKLLHHAKTKKPDMQASFVHIPKPRPSGAMTERDMQQASVDLILELSR